MGQLARPNPHTPRMPELGAHYMEAVPQPANNIEALLQRQIALLEENNRLLRAEASEWVDADTAASMLGKTVQESGSHKNVLSYCTKRGWLKTFGQLRPRTYLKAEVLDIVARQKAGLVLP